MKAVILAAGKGTRMGELTADLPKPMLPIRDKPVLEHIVEGLRDEAGIKDFFIITGWCGNVIRDHFGDGQRWKVNIAYGEQVVQDGTGKAPELAKDWNGPDKFLLTYGDILLTPPTDYKLLAEAFREDGVIAVKKVKDEELSKGGAVVLDQNGFMIDLVEKAGSGQIPPNAFYNAGIYLLTSDIFTHTAKLEKSPRGEYEFTDALKAMVKAGARLRGVTLRREWADVRDPSVLEELNKRAKLPPPNEKGNPAPSIRWPTLADYPSTSGRSAKPEDVAAGRAVFVLEADGQFIGEPFGIKVPQYAFHIDEQTNQRTPCVIIQAEEARGQRLVGCRTLPDGEIMAAFYSEFEFLGDTQPKTTDK